MKGQWYILSAVVVIAALIIILQIYQSNRVVYSDIISNDATMTASNLKDTVNRIVLDDCASANKKTDELEHFARRALLGKGMFMTLEKDINCPSRKAVFNLSVVSETEHINASWSLTF